MMAQNTPNSELYFAIRDGSLEKAREFLNQCEDAEKILNHPYTEVSPVAYAAELGNTEILQLLLEHGADINFGGKRGQMPLYTATRRGHLDAVKLCVKTGAKIDRQHISGNTALLEAVKCGHIHIVEELLKNGANPKILNNGGDSALHMAAFDGNLPLVKMLLEAGLPADLEKTEGHLRKVPTGLRPLHLASLGDYHEVAALLISHGASVNDITTGGKSALHSAARRNSLKVASLLVQHNCALDLYNENHKTPLNLAIDGVHLEMVKLLVDAGADVNTFDKWGCPALINAAYKDRPDIMLALIKGGCHVNTWTFNGISPVGACIRSHSDERHELQYKMILLLIRAGCRPTASDVEEIFSNPNAEKLSELLFSLCSLQEFCRYSIVLHLTTTPHLKTNKNRYMDCLSQLELPQKLKNYLRFEDIEDILVSL